MGRRLKARGARPDLVLTSHAVRARTTARVVATALGLRDENLVVEPRLYLASPDAILDIVAEQDDAARELLVVGHNPGFTELANRLLPKLSLDNLPTSGIVAVECDAARWIDIEQEARRLMYYDSPKSAAGAR